LPCGISFGLFLGDDMKLSDLPPLLAGVALLVGSVLFPFCLAGAELSFDREGAELSFGREGAELSFERSGDDERAGSLVLPTCAGLAELFEFVVVFDLAGVVSVVALCDEPPSG